MTNFHFDHKLRW